MRRRLGDLLGLLCLGLARCLRWRWRVVVTAALGASSPPRPASGVAGGATFFTWLSGNGATSVVFGAALCSRFRCPAGSSARGSRPSPAPCRSLKVAVVISGGLVDPARRGHGEAHLEDEGDVQDGCDEQGEAQTVRRADAGSGGGGLEDGGVHCGSWWLAWGEVCRWGAESL